MQRYRGTHEEEVIGFLFICGIILAFGAMFIYSCIIADKLNKNWSQTECRYISDKYNLFSATVGNVFFVLAVVVGPGALVFFVYSYVSLRDCCNDVMVTQENDQYGEDEADAAAVST